MSNHPSRAATRRYAWHHRELIQMLRTLGQQNRIEQQLRADDRSPYVNRRHLRRMGHIVKRHAGPMINDALFTSRPLMQRLNQRAR